jgi:hypothetical protein
MGDMLDCIDVNDKKRFNPTEIDENYKIKDLKDLARRQAYDLGSEFGNLIPFVNGALIGNHESSYTKHNHSDVYDVLCKDVFDNCEKLGQLAVGNFVIESQAKSKMLSTGLTHGRGGGGFREGYVLNHVVDTFGAFDCDISIMGHVHKLLAKYFNYLTTNRNGDPKNRVRWFGVSGCFLETYVEGTGGYFEGHKGKQSEIGYLELVIELISGEFEYTLYERHV